MDFLSKLTGFFVIDQTESNTSHPIPAQSKQTERQRRAAIAKSPMVSDKKSKGVREDIKCTPTFVVNLRFERPDIVVVENMDSINTDALIFNVRFCFF